MSASKRTTQVNTELIGGLGKVVPWPNELGPVSPVVMMLFTKNQKYRASQDWERLPGDVVELGRLSIYQANAIDLQRTLDQQGHVLTTASGATKVNPALIAMATVNGQITTLARKLGVGTASQSEKRKRANAAAEASRLEGVFDDADASLLN